MATKKSVPGGAKRANKKAAKKTSKKSPATLGRQEYERLREMLAEEHSQQMLILFFYDFKDSPLLLTSEATRFEIVNRELYGMAADGVLGEEDEFYIDSFWADEMLPAGLIGTVMLVADDDVIYDALEHLSELPIVYPGVMAVQEEDEEDLEEYFEEFRGQIELFVASVDDDEEDDDEDEDDPLVK